MVDGAMKIHPLSLRLCLPPPSGTSHDEGRLDGVFLAVRVENSDVVGARSESGGDCAAGGLG